MEKRVKKVNFAFVFGGNFTVKCKGMMQITHDTCVTHDMSVYEEQIYIMGEKNTECNRH